MVLQEKIRLTNLKALSLSKIGSWKKGASPHITLQNVDEQRIVTPQVFLLLMQKHFNGPNFDAITVNEIFFKKNAKQNGNQLGKKIRDIFSASKYSQIKAIESTTFEILGIDGANLPANQTEEIRDFRVWETQFDSLLKEKNYNVRTLSFLLAEKLAQGFSSEHIALPPHDRCFPDFALAMVVVSYSFFYAYLHSPNEFFFYFQVDSLRHGLKTPSRTTFEGQYLRMEVNEKTWYEEARSK